MVSDTTLRKALNRIALLKYFPAGNADALAAVGEMIRELYSTDAEVEEAVHNILRNPKAGEWPGAGEFFNLLQHAVYPKGMRQHNGRWVPDPANGPEYDITHPDGTRHWFGSAYYPFAQLPIRSLRE